MAETSTETKKRKTSNHLLRIGSVIQIELTSILFSEEFNKSSYNSSFTRENAIHLRYQTVNGTAREAGSVEISSRFYPEKQNGASVLTVKKEDNGLPDAMVYTPSTAFMANEPEIISFLQQTFEKGHNNVLVFHKKGIFDATETLYFQADVDIDSLPREYTAISKKYAGTYADSIENKIKKQSFESSEVNFIAKVMERNALVHLISMTVEDQMIKTHQEDVSATSINTVREMAVIKAQEILKWLMSSGKHDKPNELTILNRAFGLKDEEVERFAEIVSSEYPMRALSKAIAEKEFSSAKLSMTAERFKKNKIPFYHLAIEGPEQAAYAITETDVCGAKPFTYLSLSDTANVTGVSQVMPFELRPGDEDIALSRGAIAWLLGAQKTSDPRIRSMQLNGIVYLGEVTTDNMTLVDSLCSEYSSPTKKWIAKVDITNPSHRKIFDTLLVDSTGAGYKSFAARPDESSKYAYIFGYSGSKSLQRKTDIPLANIDDYAPVFNKLHISEDEGILASDPEYGISRAKAIESFYYSVLSRENTDANLSFYMETMAMPDFIRDIRNEKSIMALIQKSGGESIRGSMSAVNIPEDSKVFPDLLNIGSTTKYSIKEVATNPIMTSRILQHSGMAETAKLLLEKYGYPVPSVSEFVFDLENPEKNTLPLAKKDRIVSLNSGLGILNYKFIPPFISIKSAGAKTKIKEIIAKAAEKSGMELSDVAKDLEKTFSAIDQGKIVTLKSKSVYSSESARFYQKEIFALSDDSGNDICSINVPPMAIYEVMREDGLIVPSDRAAPIEASETSISAIFDPLCDFIEEFYQKNKDEWIDEKAVTIIRQATAAKQRFSSAKLYELALKGGKIEAMAKKLLGPRPTLQAVVDDAIRTTQKDGVEIDVFAEKQKIKEFITQYFIGKERDFFFGPRAEINKVEYREFFENSAVSEQLWGGLSAMASYDNMIAIAVAKIIEVIYFREMVQTFAQEQGVATPKDLFAGDDSKTTTKGKNFAINIFLSECLGLTKKQAMETKAFLLMYASGTKNTELLFWEMRTGKTRAVLAQQMLTSLFKKGDSVFFVQNKNFDDIIQQAWEMSPLLVSEMAVFIGNQTRFALPSFESPLPITKGIFPNIPAILKKMLVNPEKGSMDVAADKLSKTFVRDFEMIKTAISKHPEPAQLMDMEHSPIAELFYDHPILKRGDEMTLAMMSTYFYLKKIHADGYINASKPVYTAIKKKLVGFFTDLLEEEKLLESKNHGRVIFAGKQFIDNYAAISEDPAVIFDGLKAKISSDLDVNERGVDAEIEAFDPTVGPSEFSILSNTMRNDVSSLLLPDTIAKYTDEGNFVLPYTFSKIPETLLSKRMAKNIQLALLDSIGEKLSIALNEKGYGDFYGSAESAIKMTLSTMMTQLSSNNFNLQDYIEQSKLKHNDVVVPYHDFAKTNGESVSGTIISLPDMFPLEKIISEACKFNDIEEYEAVSAILAETVLQDKDIAFAISNALFHEVVFEVLSGHLKPSAWARIKSAFKDNIRSEAITFTLPGKSKDAHEIILPSRRRRINGNNEAVFEKIKIGSLYNSDDHPDLFLDSPAEAISVRYTIAKGKDPIVRIEKAASVINGKIKTINRSAAKVSKSISSKIFWENTPREGIVSAGVDETHRNISKNKRFQLQSLFESISSKTENPQRIIVTGTPMAGLASFANLIETIGGVGGGKFANSIIQYCGNFKFKSEFIAAIMHLASTNPMIDAIFEDFFKASSDFTVTVVDGKRKGSIEISTEEYTEAVEALFAELWGHEALAKLLSGNDEFGEIHLNYFDAYDDFKEIMNVVAKKIASNSTKEPTKEMLWTAAKETASLAPGFSNPIAFSGFFDYIKGANASFQRPADDIRYDIRDKAAVYAALSGGVANRQITEKGKAVLLTGMAISAYSRMMFLPNVKMALTSMASILVQHMRDNHETYGIDTPSEAAEIFNRSQVSVPDGVMDIIEAKIRRKPIRQECSGEKIKYAEKALNVAHEVLTNFDQIRSDAISAAAVGIKTIPVETKDFGTIDMQIDEVLAIKNKFVDISGRSLVFGDDKAAEGVIFLDENHGVVCVRNGNIEPYLYELSLSYDIGNGIPAVEFTINAANPDDASIMEAAAFIDQSSGLFEHHLSHNENIRIMTTRVAITNLSIAGAVKAAMESRVKENVRIIVNATDERIARYVNQIVSSNVLPANIEIEASTPTTINAAWERAREKKEQIVIIGNYESLAEGYNMEFVQTGFYLGALENPAATTQSFARQIGHNSKISSFYLANNGAGFTLKGGGIKHDSKVVGEKLDKIVFSESTAKAIQALVHSLCNTNNVREAPSLNSRRNGNKMLELFAHEHVMSGKLSAEENKENINLSQWDNVEYFVKNTSATPAVSSKLAPK